MTDTPPVVEYLGETAPRSKAVAALLTTLHPSLGYLYVGRPVAAGVAALLSTLALAALLALWGALQFFPLLPLATAIAAWGVMSALCMVDIWTTADQRGDQYLLRGFNHGVIYAVAFVMIALVPGFAAYHLSTQVMWGLVRINDDSMAPSLLPGDTLLVDRLAFEGQLPARGDKVVISATDGAGGQKQVLLSRVVGLPGDTVALKGGAVVLNDAPLPRHHYGKDDEGEALAGAPTPGEDRLYVEGDAQGPRYLIAGDLPPSSADNKPVVVEPGSVLLMSDHRGQLEAEPFMTVTAERIIGKPRYIIHSESLEEGGQPRTRWSRIGLRAD